MSKSLFETNETRLVNIKHGLPYDIYIGRPSIWGNPYSHKEGTLAKFKVATVEEAIEKYRDYVKASSYLLNRLYELDEKTLGCWCMPKNPIKGKYYCHGQILIELINEYRK
jgi:hypothetical protein